MEGIVNFGPNMARRLLTSGSRRCYAVGAYVPPNDASAVHCITQAFGKAPKGMEVILMGDLNVRLRESRDAREDEIGTAMANSRLGDVTDHFIPRRRYRGTGS